MDIITSEAAKSKGQKQFYTGVACKRGHDSYRYVYNGACIRCMKEASQRSVAKGRKRYDREIMTVSVKIHCDDKPHLQEVIESLNIARYGKETIPFTLRITLIVRHEAERYLKHFAPNDTDQEYVDIVNTHESIHTPLADILIMREKGTLRDNMIEYVITKKLTLENPQ